MRIITYAFNENGHVYSRLTCDGHTEGYAVPVIDFEGMNPSNNFGMMYDLTKFPYISRNTWDSLTWTKKISMAMKNVHRLFWRMKPLPMSATEKAEFQAFRGRIRLPDDSGYKKIK